MALDNMNCMVSRFSRQLLLSEIGVDGQRRLACSKVLIVGCGGLGSPATLYLAAAGVGEIGLVDGDIVAIENLHRQIIFTESSIGKKKAECAAAACLQINATGGLLVTPYTKVMTPENALDLIKNYDLVLDCTDNVASRYLINDACVLAGKPLISASALRWEGQLTVYDSRRSTNSEQRNGPCYRCLFPEPPPPGAVGSCSVNGVMGPVVGVMGSLQAVEAIKFIVGVKDGLIGRLLLFDGFTMNIRVVKLRGSNPNCVVCGTKPSLTSLTVQSPSTAVYFGNTAATCATPLQLIEPSDRFSPPEFDALRKKNASSSYIVIDVRPRNHFAVCHIEDAINIPLNEMATRFSEVLDLCKEKFADKSGRIITVCRRGNDSQRAVLVLREHLERSGLLKDVELKDIVGGVSAWKETVDSSFIVL